jgi:hypothetical protein
VKGSQRIYREIFTKCKSLIDIINRNMLLLFQTAKMRLILLCFSPQFTLFNLIIFRILFAKLVSAAREIEFNV